MPSNASLHARRALQKEVVDPSVTLADERAGWEAYGKDLPIASSVTVTSTTLGGTTCAVLTPVGSEANPTIVYAHGGGLTAGSILTHRSFASELAKSTGCTVILPEYRLLPENQPTAPSEDLIAVYLDIITNEHPVFLGGDSSGAGLAMSVMARLRDQDAQRPAGCFSISGAFDATLSGKSMRERSSIDPILSHEVLRHWQSHFPDGFAFDNPLISPLFADLEGLSPTLLLVGEDEVWYEDSTRMHAALLKAGCQSELRVFEGMWHVWPMTHGLPETEEALRLIGRFINQHS